MLRLWSKKEHSRIVCVEPFSEMADVRFSEWQRKFGKLQGGKHVVRLTGETSADLKLLEEADLVVCTPTQVRLLLF